MRLAEVFLTESGQLPTRISVKSQAFERNLASVDLDPEEAARLYELLGQPRCPVPFNVKLEFEKARKESKPEVKIYSIDLLDLTVLDREIDPWDEVGMRVAGKIKQLYNKLKGQA